MKHLTYILLLLSQFATAQLFESNLDSVTVSIVNDTLHIKGGLVQRVELNNLDTSKRRTLKEIDFCWYMIPLSNLELGRYSLKVKGYKKNAPTLFFKNAVPFNYKPVKYIDRYYFQKDNGNVSRSGFADKVKVVALIERRLVEDITKNGRDNKLYIWKVQKRIKTLIYEK